MPFDLAIRCYLESFRLPGEAQKISRIMESFGARFHKQVCVWRVCVRVCESVPSPPPALPLPRTQHPDRAAAYTIVSTTL